MNQPLQVCSPSVNLKIQTVRAKAGFIWEENCFSAGNRLPSSYDLISSLTVKSTFAREDASNPQGFEMG